MNNPSQEKRPFVFILLKASIAGTPYYDASKVFDQLSVNDRLLLHRESDNPHDTLAVAIHTESYIKLGYIPRRFNAEIAKKLDLGFYLECFIISLAKENNYTQIQFKVISSSPDDASDISLTSASSIHPKEKRKDCYQADFSQNQLEKARGDFRNHQRLQGFGKLDSALNWAIEAWSQNHLDASLWRGSWAERFDNFMQSASEPLKNRVLLIETLASVFVAYLKNSDEQALPDQQDISQNSPVSIEELQQDYEEDAEEPEADSVESDTHESQPTLSEWIFQHYHHLHDSSGERRRLNQLDWGYLSEVTALTEILCGEHNTGCQSTPLAYTAPVNRREQILRVIFRWLRFMDDTERLGSVPITRLKAVSALNWDIELIRTLQIAELQKHLDLLKPRTPTEEQKYADYRKLYPLLFPAPLISDMAKRDLLNNAIDLIQKKPLPKPEMLDLARKMFDLQPETRRRKRKRIRIIHDAALFCAEGFLRNMARERIDLYQTVKLLTICVPYKKFDRVRYHELSRIANLLTERYFGVSSAMIRNAVPPPALSISKKVIGDMWLWRDNGPIIPNGITPYHLCELWKRFTSSLAKSLYDGAESSDQEFFRQGLHVRTLLRDQLLLSSPRLARRLRGQIDESDLMFLWRTRQTTHVWGDEWEQAYGHMPTTHWWYYRRPAPEATVITGTA